MSEFDLIKQLHNPKTDEKTATPKGLKYNSHNIAVDGNITVVLVPMRESELFVAEAKSINYSTHDFNVLLRKYRGIRG